MTLAKRPNPSYAAQALADPNGFAGVGGIFRFTSSGVAERGLAVLRARSGGFDVVSPAPQSFAGPVS